MSRIHLISCISLSLKKLYRYEITQLDLLLHEDGDFPYLRCAHTEHKLFVQKMTYHAQPMEMVKNSYQDGSHCIGYCTPACISKSSKLRNARTSNVT
jgi:hypothetical protein